MKIPQKGLAKEALFEKLDQFRDRDIDWRSGRVFGYIYDPGREVRQIGQKAYNMFLTESGLDFTVFPSLRRLENELVALAAEHLAGDENTVGNFTSGGTESIILAVKAARDYCREKHPHIKTPEIILPITGHAAFHKAADYLGLKVVQTPVDPETFRADTDAMRKAITADTILLVGSAPSYAHGVVDPIRKIGQLAMENNLLFHVDACVGGFMLPYFKRLDVAVPDFDFSVPGVTSISMDLHKYAYTPKGASLILYHRKELRKFQIYACARWTGYSLVNNAVQSSKSGGPLAAAWAVIHFIGDDGYLEIARQTLKATRQIIAGIASIEELTLMTQPDMCLIAITSETVNIFHIIDEMNLSGWYLQPALCYGNSKENIHMSINVSNVSWTDAFLDDLKRSVKKAKKMPSGQLTCFLKNNLGDMDLSRSSDETFSQILSMAGFDYDRLPARMADINEALNILPPDFRERLLVQFVNKLFQYRP